MYTHKFITKQEAKCKFPLTTHSVPAGKGLRNYSNFSRMIIRPRTK